MPFIPPTPLQQLPVEEFSTEAFFKMTKDLTEPLVIRGALRDTPAVKQWSLDYFSSNHNDELFPVREWLNNSFDQNYFALQPFHIFRDLQRDSRNVSVIGASSIFFRYPDLEAQLHTPVEKALGFPFVLTQLFMSHQQTPYHSDAGANLVRQIHGRKQWTFIPPNQNLFLCPYYTSAGVAYKPCLFNLYPSEYSIDYRAPDVETFLKRDYNKFYKNDLNDMTVEKWLAKLPRYSVDLEPGDMLVVPPWYFHEVVPLADNHGDQAYIAVASRFKRMDAGFKNSFLFTAVTSKYIIVIISTDVVTELLMLFSYSVSFK
jgi:hypothetical protein